MGDGSREENVKPYKTPVNQADHSKAAGPLEADTECRDGFKMLWEWSGRDYRDIKDNPRPWRTIECQGGGYQENWRRTRGCFVPYEFFIHHPLARPFGVVSGILE